MFEDLIFSKKYFIFCGTKYFLHEKINPSLIFISKFSAKNLTQQ